jgi:hypothetical protein
MAAMPGLPEMNDPKPTEILGDGMDEELEQMFEDDEEEDDEEEEFDDEDEDDDSE